MVCEFAPRSKVVHKKIACDLFQPTSVTCATGGDYCGKYRELQLQKEALLVEA